MKYQTNKTHSVFYKGKMIERPFHSIDKEWGFAWAFDNVYLIQKNMDYMNIYVNHIHSTFNIIEVSKEKIEKLRYINLKNTINELEDIPLEVKNIIIEHFNLVVPALDIMENGKNSTYLK